VHCIEDGTKATVDSQKTILRVLNRICYSKFECDAVSTAYDKEIDVPEATKNYLMTVMKKVGFAFFCHNTHTCEEVI